MDKDQEHDDGGIVGGFFAKLFGRNYRTTLAGAGATIAASVVAVNAAAPGLIPHEVVTVASVAGAFLSGAGLIVAKDARVSGLPKR